jgi:hypothetical protein
MYFEVFNISASYAAYVGSCLSKFRHSPSVPSSRVKGNAWPCPRRAKTSYVSTTAEFLDETPIIIRSRFIYMSVTLFWGFRFYMFWYWGKKGPLQLESQQPPQCKKGKHFFLCVCVCVCVCPTSAWGRTFWPSDLLALGPSGLRTFWPSDLLALGPSGLRTFWPSDLLVSLICNQS